MKKIQKTETINFKNSNFKSIHTRIVIDNVIFTFGIIECDGEERFGYRLFGAGEGTDFVECFMPLSGTELLSLINALKKLEASGFKKKIKVKATGSVNVNFKFGGLSGDKGIKIKTYLTGVFFYSSGFFSSYIKQSILNTLVANLERCL